MDGLKGLIPFNASRMFGIAALLGTVTAAVFGLVTLVYQERSSNAQQEHAFVGPQEALIPQERKRSEETPPGNDSAEREPPRLPAVSHSLQEAMALASVEPPQAPQHELRPPPPPPSAAPPPSAGQAQSLPSGAFAASGKGTGGHRRSKRLLAQRPRRGQEAQDSPQASGRRPHRAKRHLERAKKAYQNQQWSHAIHHADAVLVLDAHGKEAKNIKRNAQRHLRQQKQYIKGAKKAAKNQQWQRARDYATAALKYNPGDRQAKAIKRLAEQKLKRRSG
jgi:hypothetical protein